MQILIIAAFISGFIGMTILNFAMDKPYKQLQLQRPLWFNHLLKPRYLRIMGGIFLLITLLLCMQIWHFSIALAVYWGLLTLVIGIVIFLSSYKATWLLKIMPLSVCVWLFCLAKYYF